MNLKVSDNHTLTLGQYLEILDRDVKKISDAVGRQIKVEIDIESKPLAPVEILEFLENFVIEYSVKRNLDFEIDLQIDKATFLDASGELCKPNILANNDLLSDLFNNLIDNAVKHAFNDKTKKITQGIRSGSYYNNLFRNKNLNKIEIFVSKFEDNIIHILFSNTGTPFPVNFTVQDFIKKGKRTGKNQGDGFGGWYINEIVQRFNGELDIIDETGDEGFGDSDLVTSFEINLPIIEVAANEEI